jgi:hypothetical protein
MEQTDNEPNGSLGFSRKRDARAVSPANPVKLVAPATRSTDRAFDRLQQTLSSHLEPGSVATQVLLALPCIECQTGPYGAGTETQTESRGMSP